MKSFLILFIVFYVQLLNAAQTVVVGIRGNEASSRWFAENLKDAVLAEDLTEEFPNGTTDVQIKTSLANKSVLIVLPRSLTPNTLMEALIKTRIARSNGARSIEIDSPVAISTIDVLDSEGARIYLPIESMFAVAGAEFVNEQGGIRTGISPENMSLFKKVEPTKSYIVGDEHPELRDELSQILKIPVLSNSKTDLSGIHIFYIAPFVTPINESFLKQMSKMRYLITRGAKVHLISPYLPYARFDWRNKPGTAVAGALAVNLMESFGAEGTFIVHAHARQSEGFFQKHITHFSAHPTIIKILQAQRVNHIMAADNGGFKNSTELADAMGKSIGGINKQRDPITKKIRIVGISDSYLNGKKVSLKNGRVVFPDDEGSKGSTLAQGAGGLKKRRSRPSQIFAVTVYITGDIKDALDSPDIDRYFSTNALPIPASVRANKKVVITSIAPEIAEGLEPFVIRGGKKTCKAAVLESTSRRSQRS